MFRKKLDKKGQGSAELILITGGLIVIILLGAVHLTDRKTEAYYHAHFPDDKSYS